MALIDEFIDELRSFVYDQWNIDDEILRRNMRNIQKTLEDYECKNAIMAEQADASDLKSEGLKNRPGSTPGDGTILKHTIITDDTGRFLCPTCKQPITLAVTGHSYLVLCENGKHKCVRIE